MEKKENQRIMLTKRLLKEALTKMLQTETLYHISIRNLCEQSGIHRSTFYKYYGSQFDLLAEMEQDMICELETTLSTCNTDSIMILTELLEYIEKNIDFVKLLLNNNIDPDFPSKLFSVPQVKETVKRLIGQELSQEEYEYAAAFRLYGAYNIVKIWVNKENREKPEWLAELVIRQF